MIVLSFILVIAAAVLLIVGLVTKGVVVIYVSIAASVVAALLLIAGLRSSRPKGKTAAGGDEAESARDLDVRRPDDTRELQPVARTSASTDSVAAAMKSMDAHAHDAEPDDEDMDDRAAFAPVVGAGQVGMVTVVSGRPRYHLADCRFVTGRDDAEQISLAEAREVGFTSCGVCRPDDGETAAPKAAPPARAARTSGARNAPTGTRVATAATKAPARTAAAPAAAPARSARSTARNAAPTKSAPTKSAPATRQVRVVIVPGGSRYHRATCRTLANAEETERVSKASATGRGLSACGICKP